MRPGFAAALLFLWTGPCAAFELPAELREALGSLDAPKLAALERAAGALGESPAAAAAARRARGIGRSFAEALRIPNLTVDPAGRSVRQGLLKGQVALEPFGPLSWDLAGHYRLGGEPAARLDLRGELWSFRAESAADLRRASALASLRRGPAALSAGAARAGARVSPHAELAWTVSARLTASARLAEGGRRQGSLALKLSPRQSLDYAAGAGAGPAHALRWALRW